MSRPRRSCTLPTPAPVLSDILERVSVTRDSYHKEFKAVSKYFKEDVAQIRTFWMSNTDLYDFLNREHTLLLFHIFELIDTKDAVCLTFLNSLTKEQLRSIGLNRVIRRDSETGVSTKTTYRTRIGDDTNM